MTLSTRAIGFDSSLEQAPTTSGRSHLLTIGIDQYRDRDIRPLVTAVRDAKDVAALLTAKYQFDPNNVQSLFDAAATQKAILKALEHLIETVQAGDVVLLYFAGHGILKESINEGFWVPADAERGDEGSYIANSLIVKYLRSIRSLHTVVIADACFAGAMFGERRLADNAQQRLERLPSRWLITSCRDTPGLDQDNRPNSPFADSLLLHLKINEKEALPVSELARSIITDVGNNYEQLPRCAPLYGVEDRGGEFAFRLKGSAAPLPEPTPAPVPNPTPGPIANPAPTPWARIGLWLLGLIAAIAGIGISVEIFYTPAPPAKVYLAAQTPTVVLGKIPLGQRDTFEFVVSNVGKTEALVNEFECKCNYVELLDTASAKIAPNESRTYRAVWLGEGQLGSKRCVIVTKGPNVVEAARTLVQAEVVDAPATIESPKETPPSDSNSAGTPPASKARLALEKTDIVNKNGVIDLGEIRQGNERTFAFKVKNLSNLRAEMTTVTSSCGALTAAKGGNTFIAPNGLGSYGGVWKASQTGAQQCTLTINGSNLEQPLRVVVKANVKAATAGGGGTVVPPPEMCKATCRSKRIGAQITLVNMDTNKEYNATTNAAGEANFSVPCDLIGQTVKVYVRGGGPDDQFKVVLARFFSTPD
jgi:hypothetical protein